jgi:hypothetical protein
MQGTTIISTVDALGTYKDTGYRMLAECGLSNPKPDAWYSMQILGDFFEAITLKIGNATLFMLGKAVAESMDLPPQIDTIEKLYGSFDQVYKMTFKNVASSEGWSFKPTGANKATLSFCGPFPDDYCRGVAEGFGKRFAKKLSVKVDETQPRLDQGGKSVNLIVSWS